jgi:hypothetical protein
VSTGETCALWKQLNGVEQGDTQCVSAQACGRHPRHRRLRGLRGRPAAASVTRGAVTRHNGELPLTLRVASRWNRQGG